MKEEEGIMVLLKVIDNMLEDSKALEKQIAVHIDSPSALTPWRFKERFLTHVSKRLMVGIVETISEAWDDAWTEHINERESRND